WTKTYGGTEDEGGGSVCQTPDGGYVITGYTYSFATGFGDVYLVKTDESGDTQWTKTYGGSIGEDWGISVKEAPDGGYIIAGITWSFGTGGWDVYLLRTDAWGDTLWTKTYGGEDNEYALSIQETSDGGYIIAGWTEPFESGDAYNAYLVKTDSDGELLWEKTYGTEGRDYGHSVCEAHNGGYVVAGCTYSVGAGDLYLIKTYDNGDTLWTKTYGGAGEDWGATICRTSDDGYIITGGTNSFGAGGVDVWLLKLEPDVGIEEKKPSQELPLVFEADPNPFAEQTSIRYSLPKASDVHIAVYDPLGRKVRTLLDSPQSPGAHTLTWDGKDDAGEPLSAGVYFLRFQSESCAQTARLVMVR
ncbi:T9SS type A sorting domain-containing protein, partial [bacterium]|nr:T9SS type A sorting domain-containing protein [bacterium]